MSPLRKIKVKSIKNNPVIKPVTWKHWFWFTLFFALLALIFIGGPALSRFITASDKKTVDKNGAVLKAIIFEKSEHKKSVYFRYYYKGAQYEESDGDRDLYDNLHCGDRVVIKIDTLNPDNAYILEY
jgi:hypothetical protein